MLQQVTEMYRIHKCSGYIRAALLPCGIEQRACRAQSIRELATIFGLVEFGTKLQQRELMHSLRSLGTGTQAVNS
jgi:hypothetical protein